MLVPVGRVERDAAFLVKAKEFTLDFGSTLEKLMNVRVESEGWGLSGIGRHFS